MAIFCLDLSMAFPRTCLCQYFLLVQHTGPIRSFDNFILIIHQKTQNMSEHGYMLDTVIQVFNARICGVMAQIFLD